MEFRDLRDALAPAAVMLDGGTVRAPDQSDVEPAAEGIEHHLIEPCRLVWALLIRESANGDSFL
jgi:hypothetical protein